MIVHLAEELESEAALGSKIWPDQPVCGADFVLVLCHFKIESIRVHVARGNISSAQFDVQFHSRFVRKLIALRGDMQEFIGIQVLVSGHVIRRSGVTLCLRKK